MIVVTGDVVLDHNVYEGGRQTPDSAARNDSHYLPLPGGATLAYRLLLALDPAVRFGLAQTTAEDFRSWPQQFHTRALWRAVLNSDKPEAGWHWALDRFLGYGKRGGGEYPAKPAPDLNTTVPRILVIDDGGLGFRSKANDAWPDCWPACLSQATRPEGLEWILLKLSPPLATGALWDHLTRETWRERLIVIVSADQLRKEGLRVAGGFSWETSVDNIVDELESVRALRNLKRCRHLIIPMLSDAALWLDLPADAKPMHCQLIFDRNLCEGEWEEQHKTWKAYGYLSTVATSLGWFLSESLRQRTAADQIDLTTAIAAGLSGTRFIRETGHGPASGEPSFPFTDTVAHLKGQAPKQNDTPEKRVYAGAEVRCEGGVYGTDAQVPKSGEWTILGQVSPWHHRRKECSFEPARRVALLGPDMLPGVPCATFGKLQSLDRAEIDALRTLRQLMLMYRDGGARKQPLCLAVFGAPGSGKSFGLKQIAKGIFGSDSPILEFNLSQFNGVPDLIGALHQVRDKVLSGPTPVVFWDEFDSRKLEWLQYFLAPMQDGTFQEGQITHSIGKSVFVFAGGTSYSYREFDDRRNKDKAEFTLKKGPDFISRLAGYLDIAGPNPRNAMDLEFPVRRAMIIRTSLEVGRGPLEIDSGLLNALLGVTAYRNGARSLDKLVTYIKERGGLPLRQAYLPPDPMLELYVENIKEFHDLVRKFSDFYAQAETLGPIIHADYVAGLTDNQRKTRPNAKPWDELTLDIRESSFAAALRIPAILKLAGLTLEEGNGTDPGIDQIIEANMEVMAEAEHGGWEEQKRISGWTYSPNRNDAAFRHNLLKPYDSLGDDKELDRNTIRKYAKYAEKAGFKIVKLPPAK